MVGRHRECGRKTKATTTREIGHEQDRQRHEGPRPDGSPAAGRRIGAIGGFVVDWRPEGRPVFGVTALGNLGLLQNYAASLFGTEWLHAASFVVLVLILQVRPTGLLGESLGRARA